jgi:hypothetical protein
VECLTRVFFRVAWRWVSVQKSPAPQFVYLAPPQKWSDLYIAEHLEEAMSSFCTALIWHSIRIRVVTNGTTLNLYNAAKRRRWTRKKQEVQKYEKCPEWRYVNWASGRRTFADQLGIGRKWRHTMGFLRKADVQRLNYKEWRLQGKLCRHQRQVD